MFGSFKQGWSIVVIGIRPEEVVLFLNQVIRDTRREVIRDWQTETDGTTGLLDVVVVVYAVCTTENVKASREAVTEEIWLGKRQAVIAHIVLTGTRADTDILATSEEVTLGDSSFNLRTWRFTTGGIATTNREFTGRLFNDIDNQNDLIRLRARCGRNVDGLEEIKRLETTLCALHHDLIEGITFIHIEFAANHEIAGFIVAADFNALNVSARTFIDAVNDRDRAVFEITIATRLDFRKSVTASGDIFGNRQNRILDFLRAVRLTRARLDQMIQSLPVDTSHIALDADIAERIALTFIDRDGDRVFVRRRIENSIGRNDAEIRIAAIVIETAERFFVSLKTTFVVDVVTRQPRKRIRTLGRNHITQTTGTESLIADKIDVRNLGARAFVDFINNVLHDPDRDQRYAHSQSHRCARYVHMLP